MKPLFYCTNINYLQKRVESRETPRGKVREIAGLLAPMNKTSCPTYHINDKEYLIVSASDIEGGHGLPLDSNYILWQLQHVLKAVNFWCGDNDIIKNVTHQVFTQSRQACR